MARDHRKSAPAKRDLVPLGKIERVIMELRGQRVILDSDLAALYGVSTKALNQQRKRNSARFPPDFVFELSRAEFESLRARSAVSRSGRGGRRYPPWAFTEHGAVMAANVLNSQRAIEVSVLVVRAFVRLQQMVVSHAALSRRLDELERKYESQFQAVFDAIRALMVPTTTPRRRIGFGRKE